MQSCPTCKGLRFPRQYTGEEYSEDARKLSLKVLFHLQQNNYEAAVVILQEAECAYLNRDYRAAKQEDREELECVANLPIDRRLTEMLDKKGYIYISDLEGVDIDKLEIKMLAAKGKAAIKQALADVRKKLAKV